MSKRGEKSLRLPSTEEDIQAARIGGVKPFAERVVLAEYDPEWPLLFAQEAARVRTVLGERVMQVEHVGSTSVPGLAAKARIDMLLVVPDSADEGAYVPPMEAAGYTLRVREPNWYEHRLFRGPATDINLHVFSLGCIEIERMLRFRDWLRSHPEDRQRYEAAKRELATREWKYVQNYADAKTGVVEDILARANAPYHG